MLYLFCLLVSVSHVAVTSSSLKKRSMKSTSISKYSGTKLNSVHKFQNLIILICYNNLLCLLDKKSKKGKDLVKIKQFSTPNMMNWTLSWSSRILKSILFINPPQRVHKNLCRCNISSTAESKFLKYLILITQNFSHYLTVITKKNTVIHLT